MVPIQKITDLIAKHALLEIELSSGQVDKIVVAPLLGFTILGNYNLAVQVINIMLIVPTVFYKYLLPQESTGIENKKPKIIVVCLSILITISGMILAPILISEFFPKFNDAIDAIRIMSIVVIPTTIAVILESEFLGKEKSRVVIIGLAITLISLIIGMIVLGYMMGIEGVAYSLVIANVLRASYYLIIKKIFSKTA